MSISTDPDNHEPPQTSQFGQNFLSEKAILLYDTIPEKQHPVKPPPSPTELLSDCYVTILPNLSTDLKEVELPYVRELGIRDSIEKLAPVFACSDYKHNLVQFWLLDVIVDCIWKCQDEFRFTNNQQKWVLEWFLFILNLLSRPTMTKGLFFKILNEAIAIGQDYIESGGHVDPIPKNLFIVNLDSDSKTDESSILSFHSESILIDTYSSKMMSNLKNSRQHIVVKTTSKCEVFKIPIKNEMVNCLSSSEDPASEQDLYMQQTSNIAIQEKASESTIEFYRPNQSTPPRFKSLSELNKVSSDDILLDDDSKNEEQLEKEIGEWHNIPKIRSQPRCPSKQIITKPSLPVIEEKVTELVELDTAFKKKTASHSTHSRITVGTSQLSQPSTVFEPLISLIPSIIQPTSEEVFKAFYNFNIWQLKNECMASSQVGWTSLNSAEGNKNQWNKPEDPKTSFPMNITKKTLEEEKEQFIKNCVLMAVRQIAFDYFENSFAFDLAKISISNPQFLLTQDINVDWNIPKDFKGEIKKPMPKKPKKEKSKKEAKTKKDKKEKSSKASSKSKSKDKKHAKDKKSDKKSKSEKKSKASDKKSKTSDKKSKTSDKKSKTSGKKSKSSDKKSDKSKKTIQGKADKKDIEKHKKGQDDLEKELIRQAENKMFMFPLKDAVNDKFFANIFPNYKLKIKKGPTAKIEKESKTSKASSKNKKIKGKKK